MDTLTRHVLLADTYAADSFNTYLNGTVYRAPHLSMNLFLKVVEYMHALYKKHPSAPLAPFTQEIKKCMSTPETQPLLIDASYHIINHTCWTRLASQLYHSHSNEEQYGIYENAFQIAFIPSHTLLQFFILMGVFFALLVQFVQ